MTYLISVFSVYTKLETLSNALGRSDNSNENKKNAAINESNTKNRNHTAILPRFFANKESDLH